MTRYKTEHKEETRKRIISAAERCFKKNGFFGIGVDGLAKEAGVTSGAFYGHFESKSMVFVEALVSGMRELSTAVKQLKEQHRDDWWTAFAQVYMGEKRICDLSQGCVLQTLTPEIGRSDIDMRAKFEQELLSLAQIMSENNEQLSDEKTWSNLATLVGGVILARAVANESLSNQIALAVQKTVR